MPKRQSEPSPVLEVYLSNLQTIRELERVKEEILPNEIKALLKDLEERCLNVHGDAASWLTAINGEYLYLWPVKGWRVVNRNGGRAGWRHSVAMCISLEAICTQSFYDDRDVPWVGLHVPSKWRHAERFARRLNDSLHLRNFHCRLAQPDPSEYEEDYPYWSDVDLRSLPEGRMAAEVVRQLLERFKALFEKRERITEYIQECRKGVSATR